MSPPERVERARPLLGAQVRVACVGLPWEEAHRGVDRAFGVIAEIHALMSFHDPASDISRLNRSAWLEPTAVSAQTFAVLKLALEFSAASGGVFDVAVGRELVQRGKLPRPPGAPEPDPDASWRDIELLSDGLVRFRRPMWVDLGGIGKGFAVDCAIDAVTAAHGGRWTINAGGDLRVSGEGVELVVLDAPDASGGAPCIELENASLASSSGRKDPASLSVESHFDGRDRRMVGQCDFVSVVAPSCCAADALTKVVLAVRRDCAELLGRYAATAFLQDAKGVWSAFGAAV